MNILKGTELMYFLAEIYRAHRLKDIKKSKIWEDMAYFSNSTETCGVYFSLKELRHFRYINSI